jgi:hypothetical protein
MRKIYIVCLILCFLAANSTCKKSVTDYKTSQSQADASTVNQTITYIIPKGEHYPTPNPFVVTSASKVIFYAVFDSSCIYKTVDPLNQNDINKLYGFSDCNTQHLINSARIGWRWSNDSLRIFAFVHNNSVMLYKEITTAKIGRKINCSINCLADQYSFTVNNKTVQLPRHCSGNYTRYKLFPYFGGDEVAPHRIKIKITELNN